jgi:methionyl-tRNA formyltransferase
LLHSFSMRTAYSQMLAPLLFAARPRSRALCAASAAKKVVFLGTPSVAARSLELLLQGARDGHGGNFELAAVVSQPPQRSGRKMKLTPSPVHELAESEGLTLLTPPNAKDEDFLSTLAALEPDLCITAAYGCFLPQRFLDLPKHGTLNIHPSLLPLYRGAAPVQRCLEAGDPVTGVSVAFTVLAMDAGPIVRQVRRPLGGDECFPELLLELFETGTDQLLDALPSVWDGSCEASLTPQDGDAATKAAKVAVGEAEVRLDLMSAREVHNRARGFSGWPGIWTELDMGDAKPPVRAKLLSTSIPDQEGGEEEATPTGGVGRASRDLRLKKGKPGALELTCEDGSVLEVNQLTLPGKKPVDAKGFWNGLNGRTARWVGSDEVLPSSDE